MRIQTHGSVFYFVVFVFCQNVLMKHCSVIDMTPEATSGSQGAAKKVLKPSLAKSLKKTHVPVGTVADEALGWRLEPKKDSYGGSSPSKE